jgi:uncharacterized protein (TIGR02266 family)
MSERMFRRRRRFQRRAVRVLVEYVSAAGPCRDFATTLGGGGMFIETDEPLAPGARIKVRFRLGGDGDDAHEIEGFVAWSRRAVAGASGSAGMGIEFKDRSAVARLARALDELDAPQA